MTVLKDASATGLRPPYLTKFEATDEPLIVLPAFLSRADSTPQADRPRDPNNVVDTSGKPIPEPSADPSALAFEPNPNLAYEGCTNTPTLFWRRRRLTSMSADTPNCTTSARRKRATCSGTRSGASGTASRSCRSPGRRTARTS